MNQMKLTQTILSKLKACRKLAGDKAEGRRPRLGLRFVTALKGRRNGWFTFSSAPSGRGHFEDSSPGYHPLRRVQPRANFRQPFRLLQMAPARN